MKSESETKLSKQLGEHRAAMMPHILYIKEKIDKCENHLEIINGRVSVNEKAVSKIISIGSTFAFIITLIMSYLGIAK